MTSTTKKALLLVLISMTIRLILFFSLIGHPERIWHRDTGSYVNIAENLIAGHGYSSDNNPPYSPDTFRTPLYPIFIAFSFIIFGQNLLLVALWQVILSTITVVLVFYLGLHFLSEKSAFIAALFLALCLGSIVFSLYIMSETLFTILLLCSIYFLTVFHASSNRKWLICSGISLGLAILCRPIAQYFPILMIFLIILIPPKRWHSLLANCVIFTAAWGLILTPWLFRNYLLLGSPTLSGVSSNNLLFYNAVSLEAKQRGASEATVRQDMALKVETELQRRGWKGNPALEIRLYRELSQQILFSDPLRYLSLHLKNDLNNLLPNVTDFLELIGVSQGAKGTLSVLNQKGLAAAVSNYFGKDTWLIWLVLPWIGLLGFTYLGFIIGAIKLITQQNWITLAFFLLPVAYLLLLPGPTSVPRFRVPAMPYICLIAGIGLTPLFNFSKRWFFKMKALVS